MIRPAGKLIYDVHSLSSGKIHRVGHTSADVQECFASAVVRLIAVAEGLSRTKIMPLPVRFGPFIGESASTG